MSQLHLFRGPTQNAWPNMQDSLLRETCVACVRASFVYKLLLRARTCGSMRRVRTAFNQNANDLTQIFCLNLACL